MHAKQTKEKKKRTIKMNLLKIKVKFINGMQFWQDDYSMQKPVPPLHDTRLRYFQIARPM